MKAEPGFSFFTSFDKVDKRLKTTGYNSTHAFGKEFRKIFSAYFQRFSYERENYIKIFQLAVKFEEIFKHYDDKYFQSKSKKLVELKKRFNKFKKDFRRVSNINCNYSYLNGNNSSLFPCQTVVQSNNKFKFTFEKDGDINLIYGRTSSSRSMVKKQSRNYKLELAKKIRMLSNEQKKGMANILPKEMVKNEGILEFDISKMGTNELRNLENYIQSCLEETSKSGDKEGFKEEAESPQEESQNQELNSTYNQQKQGGIEDILNDDAISESLSSEEEESSLSA